MISMLPISSSSPIRFLFYVVLVIFLTSTSISSSYDGGNETDHHALLKIKSKITRDPYGALTSWNTSLHFCDWAGVECGKRQRRVTGVVLQSQGLEGSLSPHVGNLSFLRVFSLANNSFQGAIPHEIGRLKRLNFLSLYLNKFNGVIPTNFSGCLNLKVLDLSRNKLVGSIPKEISFLSKLSFLSLGANKLTGGIPPFLGNITSMERFSVAGNPVGGIIPDTLEYGLGGDMTTNGDVYSFGMLLLEVMTGKKPTDDIFNEGHSLHKFASMALPDHVMDVIDLNILNIYQGVCEADAQKIEECLASTIKIGVSCSMDSPSLRMNMEKVVHELRRIQNTLPNIEM
ncbi:putative protein kinase RLK-Pelle-LRR-XII-1 family [Helianthus annuus]|nr:putative protein kinase RLK-Pelle-LRR-XII-1 family [Helianthus annuus]